MDSAFLRICDVPSSAILCSPSILMLPGVFLVYFVIPFFKCVRAPITTGIVVVLIPHILLISISRSLYLNSVLVTFIGLSLSFLLVRIDIWMSRQLSSF